MEPQDTMAGPGREEWRALGGPTQPQADTLSLCYSDLTCFLIPPPVLPVIPGSQLCWPSCRLFYYNQGPPTPANNEPGFRKLHLGYACKGHTPKGHRSVGGYSPKHKGANCIRTQWATNAVSFQTMGERETL